jgi:hypothetical protein
MLQYPAGASTKSPASFHMDDSGYEQVLVVTHLKYGKDREPAPIPTELVDDDAGLEEPVTAQPVLEMPMLQPVEE